MATAQKVKGMERKVVLVYGLDKEYSRDLVKDNSLKKQIYVLLSRAVEETHLFVDDRTDNRCMNNLVSSFVSVTHRYYGSRNPAPTAAAAAVARRTISVPIPFAEKYRFSSSKPTSWVMRMKQAGTKCDKLNKSGLVTKNFQPRVLDVNFVGDRTSVPFFTNVKAEHYAAAMFAVNFGTNMSYGCRKNYSTVKCLPEGMNLLMKVNSTKVPHSYLDKLTVVMMSDRRLLPIVSVLDNRRWHGGNKHFTDEEFAHTSAVAMICNNRGYASDMHPLQLPCDSSEELAQVSRTFREVAQNVAELLVNQCKKNKVTRCKKNHTRRPLRLHWTKSQISFLTMQ